jgi:phosphoribosylanthranilate isomerase
MGLRLKVCGMRESSNILEIAALEPDYMGFIFYGKSSRFAGESLSPSFLEELPSYVKKVGVFVNADPQLISDTVHRFGLSLVQLHGDESVRSASEIKTLLPQTGIIKAFGIAPDFDFGITGPYSEICDYFLFDTKSGSYGGTGTKFDWTLLERYNSSVPFFLSGGVGLPDLTAVDRMVRQGMNIHAVDVNSRVELAPGLKNPAQVMAIKNKINELNLLYGISGR